ncbi:MAG TPA: RNA polymerase sigma factor [Polyangiaceae bacterium]|jgi:RNA polymerase sigma-70 factor (ECF subfamily)
MLEALVHLSIPFAAVLEKRKDDAFSREAASLRPLVRAVVASIIREPVDHPDVEDCTNETLRRALEGHERLREGEAVRPWVVGIARHVALDALRSRKRSRARDAGNGGSDDDGEAMAPLVERLPDPADDPFERVAKARRDATVRDAIESLPDGQRKALTMFHLEGLGYQEIAERLEVPLGTVATWVMRGRKAIASAVTELAGE